METPEVQRFELRAVSIDVRDRVRRLAGRALLASLLAWGPLALFAGSLMGFIPLAAFALCLVTALLPRLRLVGPTPGTVAIEKGKLTLGVDREGESHEWTFARAELTRGFRTEDEVRLETRRGETLVLGVDSGAAGEAVLGALGLDARRRVLEVPIANIASRVPLGNTLAWVMLVLLSPGVLILPVLLLTMGPSMSGSAFALGWALLVLLGLGGCIGGLRQRRVAVGMDGLVFRRFLRTRFYPYGAVTSVVHSTAGVLVTLSSGRSLHLRTRGFWSASAADEAALALFERIDTARAAASGHDVRAMLPLLARRARPAGEWRAHLESLTSAASYRTGAVTARDLAAVIEDPSLSAEHRIGATLALHAAEPAEAFTLARIAAAACADEELRTALGQAAEGEVDEEQVERLATREAARSR